MVFGVVGKTHYENWKKNERLNCIQFDEIKTEAIQIRIHIRIEVVKTAPTKCKLDKMS